MESKKNLTNNVNNHFLNLSYYSHYNTDIWITVVIILIVLAFTIYFYILNSLQSFKSNWNKYKCNPIFMPFASIINNKNDGEHLDFILDNFNLCMDQMNKELNEKIQSPIDSIFDNLKSFFVIILSSFKSIWDFIKYLINLLLEFFLYLVSKFQLLSAEFNTLVIGITAFINNILSILSVIYYELVLLIKSLKLIFVVLAIGFWFTFVLPGIIAVSVGWTMVAIFLALGLTFSSICPIPLFGTWACVPSGVFWGIWATVLLTTLISTVYLIIVALIHAIMHKFGEDVLKKTLPE